MKRPLITAESQSDFIKIEEFLNKLPEVIQNTIKSVYIEDIVGIICIIRDEHNLIQDIYLPKETAKIIDFGNYIGAFSGEYIFKISGELYEKHKFNYIFV